MKFTVHRPTSKDTISNGVEEKQPLKVQAEACRSVYIAKERGIDLRPILSFILVYASPLLDGDLPAHTNKLLRFGEIEPRLDLAG